VAAPLARNMRAMSTMKTVEVYRFNPDKDDGPTTQTYEASHGNNLSAIAAERKTQRRHATRIEGRVLVRGIIFFRSVGRAPGVHSAKPRRAKRGGARHR
jgi:hypothetical protein